MIRRQAAHESCIYAAAPFTQQLYDSEKKTSVAAGREGGCMYRSMCVGLPRKGSPIGVLRRADQGNRCSPGFRPPSPARLGSEQTDASSIARVWPKRARAMAT